MEKITKLIKHYKNKKKRKEIRRKIRRIRKKIFNKKNMTKVVMGLIGFALIASYILPYIG